MSDPPQITSPDISYSLEAEEAVLGAVLTNPNAYYEVAKDIDTDDFFSTKNATIWRAIAQLQDKRDPVDPVTLGAQLQADNALEEIGGAAYLTQLIRNCPTSTHATVYANMVQRMAMRRRLQQTGDLIKASAHDESISVEAALDTIQADLDDVRGNLTQTGSTSVKTAFKGFLDYVERQHETPPKQIATGLKQLDEIVMLPRGKYGIVAGYTHSGKTGFLTTIALNAVQAGVRVLFANVADGTQRDVLANLASLKTGLEPYRITGGLLNQGEYSQNLAACGEVSQLPLHIAHEKGMTPRGLARVIANAQRETGVDMVLVDYIQRMKVDDDVFARSEYDRLSYVSQAMTILAEKYDVAVWVAAQTNDDLLSRKDKRPLISDVKGCKNIGQDSDLFLGLYRDGLHEKISDYSDTTEIIIRKNKITRRAVGEQLLFCTNQVTTEFTNRPVIRVDLGKL